MNKKDKGSVSSRDFYEDEKLDPQKTKVFK